MIVSDRPTTEQMNTRVYMQYLAAVALIGRIAKHLPENHPDRYGVMRAMNDANNVLLHKGSEIIYQKSSDGGFAAFEREQVAAIKKMNAAAR